MPLSSNPNAWKVAVLPPNLNLSEAALLSIEDLYGGEPLPMPKTAIIVEGPQGAGKSTWIKEHLAPPHIVAVEGRKNPGRLPDNNDDMALFSLINDFQKVAEALFRLVTDPEVVVVMIDRCLLSQHVYRAIRQNDFMLPRPETIEFQLREMSNLVMTELALRGMKIPDDFAVGWDVRIILPPYLELLHRREKSGREHPAGPMDYALYKSYQLDGLGLSDIEAVLDEDIDVEAAISALAIGSDLHDYLERKGLLDDSLGSASS